MKLALRIAGWVQVAHRVGDDARSARRRKLSENARYVVLYCPGVQEKSRGDLVIRETKSHQPCDLLLPPAEGARDRR